MSELILLIAAVGAGFLGALLGLGGGIILVPVLTLFFHIDIRYAIAASLISIVATSSGAAASFIKDHLTNIRLAVFLEIGTVAGAITGFLISSYLKSQWLYILFAIFLIFSAVLMLRKREETSSQDAHSWANYLNLNSSYPVGNSMVAYKVAQVPLGLAIMYAAGILSAVLGIGSGIFKVLAMDGAMKLPLKVSSATSNFMIGVTASASAGAFLMKGDIIPEIAAPVALGIIVGSFFGAKVMTKMSPAIIRKIFVVVLIVVAIQMIIKGVR